MGFFQIFSGEWIRTKVEADSAYREAVQFAQDYEPTEGTNYDWVFQQALEQYARMEQRVDKIEEKADRMVKYLGAATGVIALVAPWTELLAVPVLLALAFLVLGFASAVFSIQPEKIPIPPARYDWLALCRRVQFCKRQGIIRSPRTRGHHRVGSCG
jgi:hypothetical protein